MGRFDRSIKIAFDKVSGEILDADEIFDTKKDGFEVRRQFHEKKIKLSCCECEQELSISGSKYDRLHFKHKSPHDFCILTDGGLSPKDHEGFTTILKAKESERHKTLKNKIGTLLSQVEGVDANTISIDNKFIIKDYEKRRPDVYCTYNNKQLVFEIQLSDLSLGYILSRYEFYKKHGIYLIWILDNFDIKNQGTLERDIKYLTKYENFFKLDEKADTFKLECQYKFPFLTEDNKLLTKWLSKSIPLGEVKFDSDSHQIYYYNFGDNKSKTEVSQRKKAEEIKEAERKRIEDELLENAKTKVDDIIEEIKRLRKKKSQTFDFIHRQINDLDYYELQILNSTLNFLDMDKFKEPPLIQWIDTAIQDDVAFIEFILNATKIKLDVNQNDSKNKTTLQKLYENNKIHKYFIIKLLFKRGYKLTDEDKIFLNTLSNVDSNIKSDIHIYSFCNKLSNKSLVDEVFYHSNLLFIIESLRRKEIIGFNYKPNEWVAFANNAIQYYNEYWEYIELTFKKFGIWDLILEKDKKGTFERKLQSFYSKMPKQKFDFDEVFQDLYPDF